MTDCVLHGKIACKQICRDAHAVRNRRRDKTTFTLREKNGAAQRGTFNVLATGSVIRAGIEDRGRIIQEIKRAPDLSTVGRVCVHAYVCVYVYTHAIQQIACNPFCKIIISDITRYISILFAGARYVIYCSILPHKL